MTSWGQHQLYCFSEKNTTEGYPVALLRMPLVVSLPVYECVYIYIKAVKGLEELDVQV